MTDPESVLSPIDQLAQAVRTVPPDLPAARGAIGALIEEVKVPESDRDHVVKIAGRTALLCRELADNEEVSQVDRIIFGRNSAHFDTIAKSLDSSSAAQRVPTDMKNKRMTDGKRQREAF